MSKSHDQLFFLRHFQGLNLSKLCGSMTSNLQKLLLSDPSGCSPSEWRQDGLFNLCYSLLFR